MSLGPTSLPSAKVCGSGWMTLKFSSWRDVKLQIGATKVWLTAMKKVLTA
jgi:hypothetical protein